MKARCTGCNEVFYVQHEDLDYVCPKCGSLLLVEKERGKCRSCDD